MKARAMCLSGMAKILLMLSTLVLAGSYTSTSNAADGCGFGRHDTYYGRCVGNHPGAYARPAPYHPGCWRNGWGQLRCW